MVQKKKKREEVVYETTDEAFPHNAGWHCADDMIIDRTLEFSDGSKLTLFVCRWCNGRDWTFGYQQES